MTDGYEDIPLSDVPACECGRLKNMLGGDCRWRCAVCEVEECKRRWAKTLKWLQTKADVEAGKFVNPPRRRK